MDLNNDLNSIEEFEERVSKSVKPFDTILKIARYEYEFRIFIITDFEDDTYKALNSTGHLGLFSNDLVKDLNELYNTQEEVLFTTSTTTENYINALSHYARKYPFSFKNNLIQNGTVAADKVWSNISFSNHATEFNALIIAKSDSYRLSLQNLSLVSSKIDKLLETLRKDNM